MNFGVVLQTDPPARRVIELAQLSESLGFDYVWTFDSPVLWQEPFVIYSQILAATKSVMVGPMVTNPLSRGWAVTASLFATLNDMFGNRTVCGIGRGDSAVRVIGGAGQPGHARTGYYRHQGSRRRPCRPIGRGVRHHPVGAGQPPGCFDGGLRACALELAGSWPTG